MTPRFSPADLDPWRDPADLLDALTSVPNVELSGLRDSISRLIDHEDTDVRVHAVRRLFVHLKDNTRHQDAVTLLQADPEQKVRRVAAFAIAATTSTGTHDADVTVLLRALLDPNEDLAVRGAAYESLLLMHNRRDFPPVKREIKLEHDVDWTWIRHLQSEVLK